ncbi:hypothetical protein LWM68_09355 [Niabella sp. W65]|nr:hypothetical protein [Niabella sp. W65]MCH7362956.1 hypothetical protein [Niabella sp. W65]
MKTKLVFWSIVIALGGLLFGMDVAVISGAEQQIQHLWNLSDVYYTARPWHQHYTEPS